MLTCSAKRLLGKSRALARYHNESPSKPAHLSSLLYFQGSSPLLTELSTVATSNGECSGFSKGMWKGGAFSGHRMHSTTGLRVAEPLQQGMTEMVPDLGPLPSDIRSEDLVITRSKHLQVCAFREPRCRRGFGVSFRDPNITDMPQNNLESEPFVWSHTAIEDGPSSSSLVPLRVWHCMYWNPCSDLSFSLFLSSLPSFWEISMAGETQVRRGDTPVWGGVHRPHAASFLEGWSRMDSPFDWPAWPYFSSSMCTSPFLCPHFVPFRVNFLRAELIMTALDVWLKSQIHRL